MREYKCDILIIGAGLAGSILGFLLRMSGKDVLMVELLDAKEKDKEKREREKAEKAAKKKSKKK